MKCNLKVSSKSFIRKSFPKLAMGKLTGVTVHLHFASWLARFEWIITYNTDGFKKEWNVFGFIRSTYILIACFYYLLILTIAWQSELINKKCSQLKHKFKYILGVFTVKFIMSTCIRIDENWRRLTVVLIFYVVSFYFVFSVAIAVHSNILTMKKMIHNKTFCTFHMKH